MLFFKASVAAVVLSAASAHANCEGNNCIRAMINTKHAPDPTAYCRSYLDTIVTSTGTAAYPTDWANCQGDPVQLPNDWHITMGRNLDPGQLAPYQPDAMEHILHGIFYPSQHTYKFL